MSRLWLVLLLLPFPALGDHPLISEDADVVGKGRSQLQLHGERSRDRTDGSTLRITETAVQLSHGVRDDADVQLDLPYFREVTDGAVATGRGDLSLSYKWRFHETEWLKLVVKPGLSLPTGRDELGFGTGRASWASDFVAAWEGVERLELLGHVRYERNRNRIGEREGLWHASAAALWNATEWLKLLVDVARETNPDPGAGGAFREIVYGFVSELRDGVELGLGIKKGLSDAADDRSVLLGIKLRW